MPAQRRSSSLTLGDLVVLAFERADSVSSDPRKAATLAGRSVDRWLTEASRFVSPDDTYHQEAEMRVSQIMSRNVETCRPEDTLATAAGKMWDHDIGCLPVVGADGQLVGMLTDRDISMCCYTQGKTLHQIPVSVAMAKSVFTCRAEDALIEAEETMRSGQIRRLPVLDANDNLVGLISLNDLAREAEREVGRKGREVSAQEVTSTLAAVCEPRPGAALTVAA